MESGGETTGSDPLSSRWMDFEPPQGSGVLRIRIRCCDNHRKNGNWLKWQSLSRMFQENQWRVMRIEIGRSSCYADPPKHCLGVITSIKGYP
jgi:hypothetical protein